VPGRGVSALFGPSGSGKTMLLRCVAGLERPDIGLLEVNGDCWQDSARRLFLPAHRRPIGYVLQEVGLFPHLSVRGNLEYGWNRLAKAERRVRFDDAVDLLGIQPLLARGTERLSGGERQRVAIARALLTSPRLLLMDEPLAALDQTSKAEILPYLERLHDELAVPVIYVSHSVDEVARLADHLVLLDQGQVRGAGSLSELVTRLDLPLAHGEEAGSVIEARVERIDEAFHLAYLALPCGRIAVARGRLDIGQKARVRIHARDVSIALEHPAHTSILNILPARVLALAEERTALARRCSPVSPASPHTCSNCGRGWRSMPR
jgi:molybdate transport system ATP-binding protein